MQVTLYVLGLVSSVVVSRALGPAGRGDYYLAVTAATICVTLVDLSLTVAHMHFFAGKRYSLAQMSQNATVTALILGPLAAGGLLLVFVLTRQTVFRAADWTDFLLVLAAVPMQLYQAWMIGFFVLSQQIVKSQLALLLGAIEATVASVIFYFAGGLSVHVVLVLYLASVHVLDAPCDLGTTLCPDPRTGRRPRPPSRRRLRSEAASKLPGLVSATAV